MEKHLLQQSPLRRRSLHEECGVAGVIGTAEAAQWLYLSLFALQHRGQEGCGIVTSYEDPRGKTKLNEHRNFGLVSDNFNPQILSSLTGTIGIGHTRYSTHGGQLLNNVQPFTFSLSAFGPMAIAHNGNLTNSDVLRQGLEDEGRVFRGTSDTEVIIHLLGKTKRDTVTDSLKDALALISGAYSLVLMAQNSLYAIRDPYGLRPLAIGKKDQSFIVASETCAFDLLEAEFIRDVEPGEIVCIKDGKISSTFMTHMRPAKALCSFEPIYFSRPDSMAYGEQIYQLRKNLGRVLAEEQPAQADVVIAIPDSGVPMAMGYAEASGIPYHVGLVRNHYVGRTFIEPSQASRDFRVRLKLNPMPSVLKDKRVVVVDDSVVRGTTCVKIFNMLRKAGAKEIHFRVASPPITHSCYYGVDTPDRSKLLAAQQTVAQMLKTIGADSLGFISIAGLRRALGESNKNTYCYGCFTGNYPEAIHKEILQQPTDKTGTGYSAS